MNVRIRLAISILVVTFVVLGAFAFLMPAPSAAEPSLSCRCPAVWDPVICNDGQVYSNACWARCSGARGCKPYGGGPIQ